MKIGIIGAGHIGGTLARRFRALGHEVAIANSRGPDTLAALAAETGATATTPAEAASGRDVVVITIPVKDVKSLRGLFAGVPAATVVIDTGNYYPRQRDGRVEPIENGMTEARYTATEIGRPVVKAFNSINWMKLLDEGKPKGDPKRIAIPVAGDEPAAKAKVIALIDDLGFDGVDAGGLDESWRQEPGRPAYGADLPRAGLLEKLAEAKAGRHPDFTGTPDSPRR